MDAKDRLFADIALRLQLLSRDQVAACNDEIARGAGHPIGDIAVALGYITGDEAALVRNQAERIYEKQRGPRGSIVGGGRVAEERVARIDPRAESAPTAVSPARPQRAVAAPATRTRPEAAPLADVAVGQEAKPRKRSEWTAAPMPVPQEVAAAEPVRAVPRRDPSARVQSFPIAETDVAMSPSAPRAAPRPPSQQAMPAAAAPRPPSQQAMAAAPAPPPAPPPSQPEPRAQPVAAQPAPQPAHAAAERSVSKPALRAVEVRPASAVAKEASYLGKALALAVRHGASDLHVHSGAPLQVRVDGQLRPLSAGAAISAQAAEHVIAEITTDAQWQQLAHRGEVDFACEVPSVGRFRVNVYRQQRGLDAVFRIIPLKVPTLESLNLPARLGRLTDYRTGMVLCTGPTGCGKSSTLAALIQQLALTRAEHILTIEDPVEFVYEEGVALINQRQIRDHTTSFARALRAALREDPDVIAITELRDRETMSLAISAAETGHLVLGTLHTGNASQTISRIVSSFDQGEQEQIRVMLSESLRAVVSQRLVPHASGKGRIPAFELLMVTHAVANLIREDKTFQLPSVMQTGKAQGMVTLDDSLAELVHSGAVTPEAARRFAVKKERFK